MEGNDCFGGLLQQEKGKETWQVYGLGGTGRSTHHERVLEDHLDHGFCLGLDSVVQLGLLNDRVRFGLKLNFDFMGQSKLYFENFAQENVHHILCEKH